MSKGWTPPQIASLTSQAALLRVCGWIEEDSTVALSVSVPGPISGFTCATIPAPKNEPTAVLEQAERVARNRDRPQLVWAPAMSALSLECWQSGRPLHSALAVMSATPERREDSTAHRGLRRVCDRDTAALFRQVHAARFTGERVVTLDFFGRDEVLLSDSVCAVVVMDGSDPACAGYLHHDGGPVGGVYWIATQAKYQRRGMASLLMTALMAEAADRGIHTVVLQATSAGRPVYERLGFADAGLVLRWLVEADSNPA